MPDRRKNRIWLKAGILFLAVVLVCFCCSCGKKVGVQKDASSSGGSAESSGSVFESTEDSGSVFESTEDSGSVFESTEDSGSASESSEDSGTVTEPTEDSAEESSGEKRPSVDDNELPIITDPNLG